MSRRRIYFKYDVPFTVVQIVNSLCADYTRRARLINDNTVPGSVRDTYQALNSVIDTALDEIEIGLRREMLNDISEGRGYNRSGCSVIIGKNAYYSRKKKLIHDIAVALNIYADKGR